MLSWISSALVRFWTSLETIESADGSGPPLVDPAAADGFFKPDCSKRLHVRFAPIRHRLIIDNAILLPLWTRIRTIANSEAVICDELRDKLLAVLAVLAYQSRLQPRHVRPCG